MFNNIVEVLPIGPFDGTFSYSTEYDLNAGDIVEVPFGNRKVIGLVVGFGQEIGIKLKCVLKKYDINIGKIYLDFLNWMASYTTIPKGIVLKMILCEKTVFCDKKEKKAISNQKSVIPSVLIALNKEQKIAYDKIKLNGVKPFLLQGTTGCGKTEVYLSVIQDMLQQGKQALILLPEIALTSQLSKRVEKYFGIQAIIWNSGVSQKNRKSAWLKAVSGEKCIIIGARSALFLPFKNLGIIVVDEEHDSSYKQEDGGFYNARDMAVVLGHIKKIPIILSSATPSLESYVNAKNHKYGYAFIENRFGLAKPASVSLIDMRQCKFDGNFISPNLMNLIKETVDKGEQALIYLNRRGYSPITLCRSCGTKLQCSNCAAWLVYHKSMDKIICHYCGYKIDIPKTCNFCGAEDSYIQFGPGIERIFEELSQKIPLAKIMLVSSDVIRSEKNIIELHEKILNNEVNVIVGTQMLAKGHHFPNITLVGVVDGDLGLNCADLRASERTYQLIQQAAGRAGRAEKPGKIFIQTFNPEHSLYQALKSNNIQQFIDLEISSRKENKLPPFTKLASIIISGTNRDLTEKTARKLADSFPKNGVLIFGPAPAPLFLLRGRTRWRILLKSPKKIVLSGIVKDWILSQKLPKNIKIQTDMDPITFL